MIHTIKKCSVCKVDLESNEKGEVYCPLCGEIYEDSTLLIPPEKIDFRDPSEWYYKKDEIPRELPYNIEIAVSVGKKIGLSEEDILKFLDFCGKNLKKLKGKWFTQKVALALLAIYLRESNKGSLLKKLKEIFPKGGRGLLEILDDLYRRLGIKKKKNLEDRLAEVCSYYNITLPPWCRSVVKILGGHSPKVIVGCIIYIRDGRKGLIEYTGKVEISEVACKVPVRKLIGKLIGVCPKSLREVDWELIRDILSSDGYLKEIQKIAEENCRKNLEYKEAEKRIKEELEKLGGSHKTVPL